MVQPAEGRAGTWKDITFNYDSTDTADFVPTPTPAAKRYPGELRL